jgi:hypothetical protein
MIAEEERCIGLSAVFLVSTTYEIAVLEFIRGRET